MQRFKSFFIGLFFHSSILRYWIINKSKKGQIISFPASLTHIFIILKISLYHVCSTVALSQGAFLISLPLRADALTHWICFQNYAELKIKMAFEVFIPPTLVEGRGTRDRKSPSVICIHAQLEVLKFELKKNKRAGEEMKWRQREGMPSSL